MSFMIVGTLACSSDKDGDTAGGDDNNTSAQNDPTPNRANLVCNVNNTEYLVGSDIPSLDGCNSCDCIEGLESASISCTEIGCDNSPGCWNDDSTREKAYSIGFSFENEDGQTCNCANGEGRYGTLACE